VWGIISVFAQGLRKTWRKLSQDSMCPGRDSSNMNINLKNVFLRPSVLLLLFSVDIYFVISRFCRQNLSRSDDSAIHEMNWYNVANKYVLDELSEIIRETSVSGVWR
jgi:hypothetical protein